MKKDEIADLFLRHLVMAVPWGIVFLIVFFVTFAGIKQQVKEGIQYSVRAAAFETTKLALSPIVIDGVKQNVKEGIEFVTKKAANELKELINDPVIKQDIKEAMEYGGEKLR